MMVKAHLALVLVVASALEIKQIPEPVLTTPKLLQVPGVPATKFRTESCKTAAAKGHLSGDNAELMDLIKVKPPSATPKVACLMYSHQGARQKQRDSFATWGQDCDEFLAFSNEEWEDKDAGFKTIEVHPVDHIETNLIGKLRASYAEVLRRVKAKTLSFDFLAVGGDDTFWIIPNLKHALSTDKRVAKLQQEGTGLVYGHVMAADGRVDNAFPSGAGYVLDLKAIEKYMANTVTDSGWWEDLQLGQIMMKEGVPMLHAQAKTGEHLMHPFSPTQMAVKNLYQGGGWIEDYEKPFLQNLKEKTGKDTISPHSILFHYSEGAEKLHMHDRIHFKDTCMKNQ